MRRFAFKLFRTILVNDTLYLAQTDTTAGFLCKDSARINSAKQRPLDTPLIKTCSSFKKLKNLSRVPKHHRNLIRRSKKTTFIFPNGASFRVVTDDPHHAFLEDFDFLYSSSANINKQSFDIDYAMKTADVIVEDERGFFESAPSTILQLGKQTLKRVR